MADDGRYSLLNDSLSGSTSSGVLNHADLSPLRTCSVHLEAGVSRHRFFLQMNVRISATWLYDSSPGSQLTWAFSIKTMHSPLFLEELRNVFLLENPQSV